jgi:hypothetical protein
VVRRGVRAGPPGAQQLGGRLSGPAETVIDEPEQRMESEPLLLLCTIR